MLIDCWSGSKEVFRVYSGKHLVGLDVDWTGVGFEGIFMVIVKNVGYCLWFVVGQVVKF